MEIGWSTLMQSTTLTRASPPSLANGLRNVGEPRGIDPLQPHPWMDGGRGNEVENSINNKGSRSQTLNGWGPCFRI